MIKTAMEALLGHGFADTRTSNIDQKDKMANELVYHHFQPKERLFTNVLHEFIATVQNGSQLAVSGKKSMKRYLKRVPLPAIKTLESSRLAPVARLAIIANAVSQCWQGRI